ncbi:MAG: HTH-type transcriptional activator TipA [Pelotomaculum sp. PtaB.Bin013]|uniref:MerR family transcriptional regulator n=1 Tax=Pelotomaculum isophthalicicum JI TaxID=947010 RepID=A0A9X4H1H9_9FIRM|nr:MerR family transcriptional regulator [Pelotomaculum isophthalicicum]MDF9408166.1 MerR family transcriptional regulator [Pelotomaculum isophthalicicum JI]OPX89526.1 MAG: HTH-type transcriptional activator TipA [Pelotomaculum sp. PtaB.Bin013]
MGYTINQVAQLAGVTIRTLRYYDKIGLLTPSTRTEAGYRIYSQENVERLQQILFFRELDFPLAKIIEILNNPAFDRQDALKMQAEYLERKAQRYLKLSQLAKETLRNLEGGNKMEKEDMFKGFDYGKMMEGQKQYEDEVKERWGNTKAYKTSMAKTAKYTKEDWERINSAQMQNLKDLYNLYNAKVPHDDPRVQEVVDRSRRFISDNFYECSLEIWSGLGKMYVSDKRFTAYYDKFAPGLAAYYNDAIQHYCINKA